MSSFYAWLGARKSSSPKNRAVLDNALKTMTSALSESVKTTSAFIDAPPVTLTDRRRTLKFKSRNVSSALPGGTASNR